MSRNMQQESSETEELDKGEEQADPFATILGNGDSPSKLKEQE